MTYYHCSSVSGLKVLKPCKPQGFDKPARVYMTTLLPMALMYSVRNFEYTYGYTKTGQIYFEEYFPNALETLYRGKCASLYLCAPECVQTTAIPNEAVCDREVVILSETEIPDACEALLEQERLGALIIRRYHELTDADRGWILKAEAETIRKGDLLHTPGERADYYRLHYPDSWALAYPPTTRACK